MPARNLRITLILLIFALLFLNPCFPKNNISFKGEVTENNINIRTDSTVSAEVITTVNRGIKLDVVRELYDWYRVILPSSSPAYIRQDLLECIQRDDALKSCSKAKVAKEKVNVRLKPDETSAIIGKANKDETVTVVGETKGWFKIRPTENCLGWINKKFVEKIPEDKGNKSR